jgi:hypothetical protein
MTPGGQAMPHEKIHLSPVEIGLVVGLDQLHGEVAVLAGEVDEARHVLHQIAEARVREARAGAAGAFAIAARIVENAWAGLMNARRGAPSEG